METRAEIAAIREKYGLPPSGARDVCRRCNKFEFTGKGLEEQLEHVGACKLEVYQFGFTMAVAAVQTDADEGPANAVAPEVQKADKETQTDRQLIQGVNLFAYKQLEGQVQQLKEQLADARELVSTQQRTINTYEKTHGLHREQFQWLSDWQMKRRVEDERLAQEELPQLRKEL